MKKAKLMSVFFNIAERKKQRSAVRNIYVFSMEVLKSTEERILSLLINSDYSRNRMKRL